MNLNNGGGGRKRRRKPVSEINITPMVDVMLVLLVIFMVAAPMMTTGVDVNLPKESANNIAASNQPLTVSMDKNNRIYINNERVLRQTLTNKIISRTKGNKNAQIILRADKIIPYGDIMRVIVEINNAGYSKLSLVTESE